MNPQIPISFYVAAATSIYMDKNKTNSI